MRIWKIPSKEKTNAAKSISPAGILQWISKQFVQPRENLKERGLSPKGGARVFSFLTIYPSSQLALLVPKSSWAMGTLAPAGNYNQECWNTQLWL